MINQPSHQDIGTVALPAYVVFYRNPRTTNRWYVHRGYTMEADAMEVATAFKRVGMDVTIYPLIFNDEIEASLKILNAF